MAKTSLFFLHFHFGIHKEEQNFLCFYLKSEKALCLFLDIQAILFPSAFWLKVLCIFQWSSFWSCAIFSLAVVSNKLCITSVTWREERNRIYVGKRENLRWNTLALGKQQLNGTTMWQLLCVRRSAYPLSLHLKTLASIKTLRVVISIIANKLLEFALHFLIDTLLNRRYFIHT